jgi:hypothetical protein
MQAIVPAAGLEGRHGYDGLRRVGIALEKLANHGVGVEIDGSRVGADERAAKDSRGPLRHVVALQRVEERELDLGLLRNRDQGNLLLFSPFAHSCAETLSHADTSRGSAHAAAR